MGLSAHPARMLASSTEKGLCFRSFLASAKAAGWVRMLSWDDFRYVKAIAEARSLAGAGEHLGVNIPRCSVGSARSSSTSARACSSAAAPVMRSPPAARRWSISPSACFRRSSASSAGSPARTCGLRGTADHRQRRPPPASPERGVRRFSRVYPQIILDIVVSNQRLNLTKRDADVAVRAAYQAVFGAAAPGADRSCATASPQNLR